MESGKSQSRNIKEIIGRYLRYWYLFAAFTGVAIAIAYTYLRYADPIYMARTSVVLKGEKSGSGPSESAAFSDIALLSADKSIENEIFIFKSRRLMEDVIRELELSVVYIIEGQVRDVEIYGKDLPLRVLVSDFSPEFYGKTFEMQFRDDNSFRLSAGERKSIEKFGQEIEMPYGKFTIVSEGGASFSSNDKPLRIRFENVVRKAESYSNRLNIRTASKNTSALVLSFSDPVPEKALNILETLIPVYNEETVQDKREIARRTVEFIDERLDYLTQELNRVEQNVEDYKQQYELTDVETQAQQYSAEKSASRREVEEINVQIQVLTSIEDYLSGQAEGNYNIVPSTLTIEDGTLNGLIAKFNELQLERERVLRNMMPSNPVVLNMNDQLDNLIGNIKENLRNIKSSLQISRRNMMAKAGMVDSKVQMVPMIERQLIEITRQQEIKRSLYIYLLQKKEEASLTLAASVSDLRIVDPPLLMGQVAPKKANIYGYAVILGLFIPFLGIYIKELVSSKIETRSQVESLTRTPILGEICLNKGKDFIVANVKERTAVAEMFRLLRTNLRFALTGNGKKVVLVTSSMNGEGKSFFSVNMATTLAGAGKKVIIMECDLRRPTILEKCGISETKKGLTDYIIGDIDQIEDLIFTTDIDKNMDILPAGSLSPNPAEILLSDKIEDIIKQLREKYDYVILDTPPVGMVADALTLNEFADLSVYLVRYNYTEQKQLKTIEDLFMGKQLNNPLLVLNGAKKVNSTYYTYGY
ncbi:MAG: GumC family protein [Cryomorphaceae bacterium]|nr:polysaccharide biosynthesis tyrosine autokinase [Flavobacteriales bacterium]